MNNIFQHLIDTPETITVDDSLDESSEQETNDLLENTIDKKIKKEKHRELVLKNEETENNLIPKKMINAVMGELFQSIQTNFVDFARRESPTIAAIMGVPEKERDLENYLKDKIKTSLAAVKSTSIKLLDDGIYE